MAIPTLNGTAIYPSDVQRHKSKVGKPQINANGVRTFIHRTGAGGTPLFQSYWELTFNGITEARRAAIITLAAVATTMTWVDQNAASLTVHTEDDAYSESVSLILPDGTFRYDCKLTLYEG